MIKFLFKNSKKSDKRLLNSSLDSFWFQKAFIISFCFCGSFLLLGNVFKDQLFPEELKRVLSSQKNATEFESLIFPSFPVNLKTSGEISPVLVKIELKTDKPAAKQEIVLKTRKFKKYLLLLLSGQSRTDLEKNRAWFEEQIRSQFNVFLSKGSVKQVEFHTALIN